MVVWCGVVGVPREQKGADRRPPPGWEGRGGIRGRGGYTYTHVLAGRADCLAGSQQGREQSKCCAEQERQLGRSSQPRNTLIYISSPRAAGQACQQNGRPPGRARKEGSEVRWVGVRCTRENRKERRRR